MQSWELSPAPPTDDELLRKGFGFQPHQGRVPPSPKPPPLVAEELSRARQAISKPLNGSPTLEVPKEVQLAVERERERARNSERDKEFLKNPFLAGAVVRSSVSRQGSDEAEMEMNASDADLPQSTRLGKISRPPQPQLRVNMNFASGAERSLGKDHYLNRRYVDVLNDPQHNRFTLKSS